MHVMRFSWSTFGLFGGLVALLVALGVLQYRWQNQISESQREKMHKMAQEEAGRFAEDFNKQIQNAYFNFQVGAEDWRARNYRPFVERYEFWQSKTDYPELINGFYFFDAAGNQKPLRYDKAAKTFAPVDWTPELRDLFDRSNQKTFHAIYEDIYTLVLPQHEVPPRIGRATFRTSRGEPDVKLRIPAPTEEPKTFGYLAIKLDPAVIRDKLLPDLAAKNFPDSDFYLSVTDRNNASIFQTGQVSAADASSGLFELSPSDVYFFANRDIANSLAEKRQNVIVDSSVESHTMTRAAVNGRSEGTVKFEIKRSDRPKTEIFTTKLDDRGGHWTLSAQHSAGSIDTFIAKNKNRNLAMGYGILGLLGLAVAAIIFSTQRARQFAQRQVDFVSSVSHEFRTPLAVIYSAGENLADGVANDAAQTSKYGELIKSEGRKLSAMVEQILEFAGANSRKRTYKFQLWPVAQIVDDAIRQCGPLLESQNVDLEIDVDADLPVINADPEALSRAIQNLVANSIKYRNGNSWMRVSASNGDGTVKITVEDRGIGISKGDLRQVFEPFFRSKEVVDAQIHGNGLGLAIVKQIAEAHCGRVMAESEPGQGSKFTIELPVEN